MFLRNAWYVAATDREIGRKPLRRIIMNEPIVMYRTEAGAPVALEDRCVHRHLPLSMGRLEGAHWRYPPRRRTARTSPRSSCTGRSSASSSTSDAWVARASKASSARARRAG
jgi:hypothetical protein